MSVRRPVTVLIVGLLLLFGMNPGAGAQSAAVVKKIDALNTSAIAAYDAGDNQRAKNLLLEAVVMGKENGLGSHAAVARSYVHLGLVHVEGLKDAEKGLRYFVLAQRIQPEIKVAGHLATAAVTKVFDQARGTATGERTKDAEKEAAQADAEKRAETRDDEEAQAGQKLAKAPPSKPLTKAQQRALEKQEKLAVVAEQKEKNELDAVLKDVAQSREREAKERLQQAKDDAESLRVALAQAEERAGKEREVRVRLQKEKADLEKELADTRAREQREREAKEQVQEGNEELQKGKLTSERQLHKQFAESEKALHDQLQEAETREKKEREAKQRLQQEKADLEKSLRQEKADLEKRLQQEKADLEKRLAELTEREKQERAEKERVLKEKQSGETQLAKQLAEAADREKKEREGKEKLAQERQQLEARAIEQKQLQEKERLEREKLAEGPDLPSSIPQPLFCATQDEAQLGLDLYVHCAPQPQLKATGAALYYRASGSLHFNSLAMERNKKGWFVAAIPGAKVAGKIMQFYVQARSRDGDTLASNGKQASPNVILLKKRVTRTAETANLR